MSRRKLARLCLAAGFALAAVMAAPGSAYAGEDDAELVEVVAPSLCCLPSGLGALTGWGPTSGPGGMVSLRSAANKSSKHTVRNLKKKRQQKPRPKPEEKPTFFDELLRIWDNITTHFGGTTATGSKVGTTGNNQPALKNTDKGGEYYHRDYARYDPETGRPIETEEITKCTGSAEFCTMREIYQIVDPTDGMIRFSYHLAVVRPVYMPKHYDADENGYAPQVVDGQEIWLVFDTYADLERQLEELRNA